MTNVLLEGIFRHLVREGVPLSVRDLTDAIRSLEAGHGAFTRERLSWLCQTLWARTEEEQRRIALLFHQHLPRPTQAEVNAATGAPPPLDAQKPTETQQPEPALEQPVQPAAGSSIEFSEAGRPGGIGVPRALVRSAGGEAFVLTPKPLVPERACIITWRRYWRGLRIGPKTELDVPNTIHAKAQSGLLLRPVMVAPRSNQAKLVLLVDQGPGMAAFGHSTAALADSLQEGRLAISQVYYFHQTPAKLFEGANLTQPVELQAALEKFSGMPALIVSDAGSASGGIDTARIAAIRDFLRRSATRWTPLAWLNPMPQARWRGTSAASIARLPGVLMKPFGEDGLVYAIDVLRGKRQS